MESFFKDSVGNVTLQVVQCYRSNEGYSLLTHAYNQNFTTWCLVCKDSDTELTNVRNVSRADDVMNDEDGVLCLGEVL